MTGAPQIFCVFPEVNATETAIPSKQASCLPVLLHSRGLGGAAHCPIAGERPGHGWRTAALIANLTAALQNPLKVRWTDKSLLSILSCTGIYIMGPRPVGTRDQGPEA